MIQSLCSLLILGYTGLLSFFVPAQKVVFRTNSGTVKFVSEAPLETIRAESKSLKGIIDTTTNTFAFSITIISFQGFNSALQEQHFYENYMESTEFPLATFSGKIIELIDFSKAGTYQVRAKGMLNIHGVKIERIIKSNVEVRDNEFLIQSTFTIHLQEHNIKIPRIVNQKIAPDIQVDINAVLKPEQI